MFYNSLWKNKNEPREIIYGLQSISKMTMNKNQQIVIDFVSCVASSKRENERFVHYNVLVFDFNGVRINILLSGIIISSHRLLWELIFFLPTLPSLFQPCPSHD